MSEVIKTKVAIVGGGIAGLKAAQTLAAHGISFTLLEARDRLGGRIDTKFSDEIRYDMGASWAHDTLTNPLFDEMVEEDNLSGKYDLFYDDGKPFVFTKDPEMVFEHDYKIDQAVHELQKYIEIEFFEKLDTPDVSLKEMVEMYVTKQSKRKLLSDAQKKYAPQVIRNLELWHGIAWTKMSSKFAMVDNVGRNCLIRGGYSTLVESIVKTLPEKSIHLGQVVKGIDRSARDGVKVVTSNGNTYIADYVIVTVPQSILQISDPKQPAYIDFVPPLTSNIQSALKNMSYGKLGKFVFEFPFNFWKDQNDAERYIAIADPEMAEKQANSTRILPEPWSFPVLILNMSKIFNSSKTHSLLVFTQGELTEYLEEDPSRAWEYMKPILSRLGGSSPVPDPISTHATQWTRDPYALGSYAACEPGNDPTELVIYLSQGLDKLRFAGEHTILDGAGAVHGAWMSGLREAEYILEEMGIEMETKHDKI